MKENTIVDSLKKNFTGDNQKDTDYLLTEMEKYKNDQSVLKEIYKLLFELLPEDLQHNFVSNINQQKFEQRLKEIQELVYAKDNKRALEYLDLAIQHIDKVYEDDEYEYKTFHGPLEAYIYASFRDNKQKKVKNSELDFGVYYKFRGIILNNLNRFDEALEAFNESMKWNNLDFETWAGISNSLKGLKKFDELYEFNLKNLKYAFSNMAIAEIMHNIGVYYMSKGDKESDLLAYYIISYSIAFAETEYAFRDLNTICEKYNMKKQLANEDELFKVFKKNNLPTAPDIELIKFLINTARKFIGVKDDFALYIFKVVYALTHDEVTLQYIQAGEKAVASKKQK